MAFIDEYIPEISYKINSILDKKGRVIAAVDGRCASGKTTLAGKLSQTLDCSVFHMDDFFLRPEQRTKERLDETGGNVDRERFRAEVIEPLLRGENIEFRPFDCKSMSLAAPVRVTAKPVNIIEGAYSCHPAFCDIYDLRIFLSVSCERQLERIGKRSGSEALAVFREKWIPLEERYFSAFDIAGSCDMFIET